MFVVQRIVYVCFFREIKVVVMGSWISRWKLLFCGFLMLRWLFNVVICLFMLVSLKL